jgi:hypothetical protein
MKRKLRIDDLSVASFPTGEEAFARRRGTVRGASGSDSYASCIVPETCIAECQVVQTRQNTCAPTCHATCDDRTCNATCFC